MTKFSCSDYYSWGPNGPQVPARQRNIFNVPCWGLSSFIALKTPYAAYRRANLLGDRLEMMFDMARLVSDLRGAGGTTVLLYTGDNVGGSADDGPSGKAFAAFPFPPASLSDLPFFAPLPPDSDALRENHFRCLEAAWNYFQNEKTCIHPLCDWSTYLPPEAVS